ncbi:MAG: ornithine carbamoyltransferase [Anaerolineales bacterium]|nr:ornithine carbamoyltransferase [Anaerolineales bacterium]
MRHFIALTDYSSAELDEILMLAQQLKKERNEGGNKPLFAGKVLAMVFQKPSLRTRVSFDMAMRHLGGDALYLSPAEIGLGKRESIADVSRVLSGYVDAVMARVFEHEHILELAKYSSIPVINGLSDFNHPCQAMADMLTILESFDKLKDLRMTFIGDGNNVAVSLVFACAKLGMHFTIASPEGYDLPQAVIKEAEGLATATGSNIQQTHDPIAAIQGADVIYTDTWTSMGQEDEAQKRREFFAPYQVNEKLVSLAKKDVIVMHCLPAHRGEEITDEVADGSHSVLFQQAENRLHAQKAILVKLMSA